MIPNYEATGKNSTPFNPQLDHFDQLTGYIRQQNKTLRFVVVIACLSFFLSIGISFYAVTQPESIPVLITMNDFGQPQYIGAVSRRNYQNFSVPEIAIHYQVKDFINLYHTLSTDRTVMKKGLNKTYHMLTSTTSSKFSNHLKEETPFSDFGSKTREVFFQTEPLKLSNESYQVDFQVVTRSLSGSQLSNITYRAIISVRMLKPSDEDIKDNPLGIYITAFDFKEIDTTINRKIK